MKIEHSLFILATNKIKLDPVKPPVKRKSKSENEPDVRDRNGNKENEKAYSGDDSIRLRSGTKLNQSGQKSVNVSNETVHNLNGISRSPKLDVNLEKDKETESKGKPHKRKSKRPSEKIDVPAHDRSTRSNLSKLKNIPSEIHDDSSVCNLKSELSKVNKKELDTANQENHIENNILDDVTTKGLPTFDQNSKALLMRRKLYSQNLDIEDHVNMESSFLESVNVKNIYEPKKRESKNRQSSDQVNLLSCETNKGKVETLNKYSLRRNDTANDEKNEGTAKLTKLLAGILNGINNKKNGTLVEKNFGEGSEHSKNKKTTEIINNTSDNEKLDDSDLNMFNVKSHLKENTAKQSSRLQKLKKSSPLTRTNTVKKESQNTKKETAQKEASNTKKEMLNVRKEMKSYKTENSITKNVIHDIETVDIVTLKNHKKPELMKKNYEFKHTEVKNASNPKYEKFYSEGNIFVIIIN